MIQAKKIYTVVSVEDAETYIHNTSGMRRYLKEEPLPQYCFNKSELEALEKHIEVQGVWSDNSKGAWICGYKQALKDLLK
jgi:hypothetical protein